MEQIHGTPADGVAAQLHEQSIEVLDASSVAPAAPAEVPPQPLAGPAGDLPAASSSLTDLSSFGARGRARRRARFLRRARELAYRDLGGLVFNLHRFSQRNDALVLAKLNTLERIDEELRALEDVLGGRRPVTVLREAGIIACARCAAIHSSEDRFCPNCGLGLGRNADLPGELLPPASAASASAPLASAAPASTAPASAAQQLEYSPAAAPAPDTAPIVVSDIAPVAAPLAEGAPAPAAEGERGHEPEDDATVIIRPGAPGAS